MVCRCRDGTYGSHCCKTQRGRRNTSRRNSRAGGPNIDARASGAASRRMMRYGKALQQIGFSQISNSYLSKPKGSGKIWTGLMVSDVGKRGAHRGALDPLGNPMYKNKRKYDWRPKSAKNYIGYKDMHKRKYKHESPRSAHAQRRPGYGKWSPYKPGDSPYKYGIYSQPSQIDIAIHRRGQRRRGSAKVALGTGLRTLGKGLLVVQLGTYGSWLYEDPSPATVEKIAKDITLYENIESIFIAPIRNFGSSGPQ